MYLFAVELKDLSRSIAVDRATEPHGAERAKDLKGVEPVHATQGAIQHEHIEVGQRLQCRFGLFHQSLIKRQI